MDIPRCIIRLIFDSYLRLRACVTWKSTKSLYFSIHNGVKQSGVISPIFFNLYLNPMLIRLMESRICCHINNVFIDALAYADDVTIIYPTLRALNNKYAAANHSMKTVCIKYDNPVMGYEKALLNGVYLSWTDNVRHLGNYMCSNNDDLIDCTRKKSMFIGYVNKLRSNYGNLQHTVLMNLFKSYGFSFYGSILWKLCSKGFDKISKSWNVAIRTLLKLPYNAHTIYLGPLINQLHLSKQLYITNFLFLLHASRSDNCIVKACMNNSKYSSNSCIGYQLIFFSNHFSLDMDSDLKQSVARLSVNRLDLTQQVILDNIRSLLNVKTGVRKNLVSIESIYVYIIYLLIKSPYDFNIYIISIIIIIVCIYNIVCHNITVYHVSME